MPIVSPSAAAIDAQAELHQQLFIGLQLMIASREGPAALEAWLFRLFRRQHEAKFLSSFHKLGLDGLPHAVACARYHVLSNGVGGVPVEYMEESPRKAWVRFRYPRWMFEGPAICGIPAEASHGFLRGWYAQNGVTLGNPRLGFVCVSQDMVPGDFGFCGYFREFDHDLSDDERLQFSRERPPPFDPAEQPRPPEQLWTAERLARAKRNYAIEYIRNGISVLTDMENSATLLLHAQHAARLIGLQGYAGVARATGAVDGGLADAAACVAAMLAGMDDEVDLSLTTDAGAKIEQRSPRILNGLSAHERLALLAVWRELWRGILAAHRTFMSLDMKDAQDQLIWTINQA